MVKCLPLAKLPTCPAASRVCQENGARNHFSLARLSRLSQRGDDTRIAVGSDLMTTALEEGYVVLKVMGKGQGVDDLRRMLANRFARGSHPSSLAIRVRDNS